MELIDLLRIMRRWLWLIVVVVVVIELALWLGVRTTEPVYAATVSLQVSSPQRADVAAYDEYRSISLRDEIVTAINNFVELLQSDEVRQRVVTQLGLEDKDAFYTIAAKHMTDADFVNVKVEARTPSLAAEIANTHVSIAIAYYGELRAKTTNAEKNLFAEQLRVAEQEYQDAEKALTDFRAQNGIFSLESQITTQQKLLEQLQLERDQRLLEQAATVVPTPDPTLQNTSAPAIDLVGEVDKLIAQRQKELDGFTALAPQYNILTDNVEQTREAYQHLLSKYSEAEVKVTAVQAANFIQVIKPATAPIGTDSSWPKLAVLALAGSLGLGVMLAFLLQYISDSQTTNLPAPKESEHKTPSRRHVGQELWKRLRHIFRENNQSHEGADQIPSTDLDTEQEPAEVQDQQASTEEPARRKRSSRKTRSTDTEQEPAEVQDQQAPTEKPARRKRSSRKTRSTDTEQEPTDVQDQQAPTEIQVE
jgi:uncharacterized protein involved in exopolysaccharide biosynthesis